MNPPNPKDKINRVRTWRPNDPDIAYLSELSELLIDFAIAQRAELDYVYECARRRRKPRWDELEPDCFSDWLECARDDIHSIVAEEMSA